MKKSNIAFYFGMAVTAFFILYALFRMDFREAINAFTVIDPLWILPIVFSIVLSTYLRAARWWYLLEPIRPLPMYSIFSSTAIGFMGNMIFPMKIGEFIRAYVLGKKENIKTTTAFTTIVIERVFDLFSLMVITLITIYFVKPENVPIDTMNELKIAATALAIAVFGLMATLYLLADEESKLNRLFVKIFSFMPPPISKKATSLFQSFTHGILVVKKGKHLLATMLYSCAVWFSIILPAYLVLPLFQLSASWEIALVLTLFTSISAGVPSSPGYIGPFHAAVILTLGIYGIDSSLSLGMAIIMHGILFLSTILLGLPFLFIGKLTFSEILHSVDEQKPDPE